MADIVIIWPCGIMEYVQKYQEERRNVKKYMGNRTKTKRKGGSEVEKEKSYPGADFGSCNGA